MEAGKEGKDDGRNVRNEGGKGESDERRVEEDKR